MRSFHYFCIFHSLCIFKKVFIVSIYKGLLDFLPKPPAWETFLACFIVLDNLREAIGCSIVTDFMPIMFCFSSVLVVE